MSFWFHGFFGHWIRKWNFHLAMKCFAPVFWCHFEYKIVFYYFWETKFPKYSVRFPGHSFIGNYVIFLRFPWVFQVFSTKIQIPLNFPGILTFFQIPWVFQVFHVSQVCGHAVTLGWFLCNHEITTISGHTNWHFMGILPYYYHTLWANQVKGASRC